MKRNAKLSIMIALVLIAITCLGSTTSGECEKPEWGVGDKWDYQMSSSGIGMNMSLKVEEIKTIKVNETSYEVYSVKSEMKMSLYGIDITSPGHNYYRKSDLALVKTEMVTTFMTISSGSYATYSPPKKDCCFPMDVGKTWSDACTQISYSTLNDEMTSYDEYETKANYTVEKMETVTVPAGTFECYKIVCEDEWGDKTLAWYSPKVKNFVKQSSDDPDDPVTTELKSYKVTSPKGAEADEKKGFGMEDLFAMPYVLLLILIPIIVVVLAVGLVARSRKKKRTAAQIQSKETVDFVVPSAQTYAYQQTTYPAGPAPRTQQAVQRPPPQRQAPPQGQYPPQRQAPPQRQTAPQRPQQQAPPSRATAQPRPVMQSAAPAQRMPPPPPPPPPPAVKNPCPTCRKELSLIQQYNRWYCHNCKKYW